MKKKFLGLATVLGLGLVINSSEVKAAEGDITTADKNYSISVQADHSAGAQLIMTLGGSDYVKSDDVTYYVYLSNDANAVPTDKVTVDTLGCNVTTNYETLPNFKLVTNSGQLAMGYDWYMLNGYNYAYVVKETKVVSTEQGVHKYCEFSNKAIEVKQPELEAIGSRYQYYVFSQQKELNVFPFFPHLGSIGSHTINTKIGLISDKDLLNKLAKKQSGSMNELLEYAKTAEGKTYSYSDSQSFNMDLNDFAVTNGAYYFIYSTYENNDGLYRDLSDVTIVMGKSGMLVNEVTWDINPDDSNGGIVNPKTGIQKPYLCAIVVALLAGACFICIRRIKIFSK